MRTAKVSGWMGCGLGLMLATAACSTVGSDGTAESLQPPDSWTAEEQQIIDLYDRFRTELTETTRTVDGELDVVEALSTPRLSEALIETIVADRSVGNVIDGTYAFTPLSVTLDDDEAQIVLCEWDQTFVVNEGEQLSDVPGAPSTAKIDMQLTDGSWLVNGVFDGEGQPCELVQ